MDLHHDPVGSDGHAGASHGRNQGSPPCAVAGIGDHGQVGKLGQRRDGGQVQRVPGVGFKGSDAALAQEDVRIAAGQDVFCREQQLLDRGA